MPRPKESTPRCRALRRAATARGTYRLDVRPGIVEPVGRLWWLRLGGFGGFGEPAVDERGLAVANGMFEQGVAIGHHAVNSTPSACSDSISDGLKPSSAAISALCWLQRALTTQGIERRVVLELPGFLGLGAIIGSTDLLATLPRHIGTTLAHGNDLALWPCPLPVDRFEVAQYWHPRFDNEPGSRWLRELVAELFGSLSRTPNPAGEPAGLTRRSAGPLGDRT